MDKINKNDDDYYYYIVRINIKKYRKIAKMTAQELADKTGFSHQFIRDLESLKITKRPRLDSLGRIAKALNIDIKQLFDEVNESYFNEGKSKSSSSSSSIYIGIS